MNFLFSSVVLSSVAAVVDNGFSHRVMIKVKVKCQKGKISRSVHWIQLKVMIRLFLNNTNIEEYISILRRFSFIIKMEI